MATIETRRLRLRPFTLDDLDAYWEGIHSDAEAMRYMPPQTAVPKERTERTINAFLDHWAEHGYGIWAVELKETGEFIGHTGLYYMRDHDKVEIAYAFSKPHWGKGYAAEASHAALRWGFENTNLAEIIAVAIPANMASQRVMQKIGMENRGTGFFYDTDMAYYAMRRENFVAGDVPYTVS